MNRGGFRSLRRAAVGRGVSTGSTFSTILLHHAITRTDLPAAARVLDVGCGRSPYRELFAPDHYVGLDRGELGPSATVAADASALPFRDDGFDGILCTEVIEHVPDERVLVEELHRVARPGAALVLSSPFVHGLHEIPYDFRRLTSIGLTSTLSAAGWHVTSIRAVGGPAVVSLDSLVRWADATLRRIARRSRVPGALRAATSISGWAQQALASAVLANPMSQIHPIEPDSSSPRLTLGYVVRAHR